jgi:phosphate uptake regulator
MENLHDLVKNKLEDIIDIQVGSAVFFDEKMVDTDNVVDSIVDHVVRAIVSRPKEHKDYGVSN